MKTNIKKKTDVKATGEKKVKCLENKLLSSLDEKKIATLFLLKC